MSTLWQWNYALFQAINAPAGMYPWLDHLMVFCADLLIFCWPLLLLLVWGIPLSWSRRRLLPGEERVIEERRAVVLWVALACVLAYAFNLLAEHFVFEPRPFVSHRVHQLVAHAADSSFPSDHTAWSFAVVGMLLFAFWPFLFSTRQRATARQEHILALLLVVAVLLALCIGFARIYVGVHYPDDILGGAVSGLLASGVVTWLRQALRRITQALLRFATLLRLA